MDGLTHMVYEQLSTQHNKKNKDPFPSFQTPS